jgi:hypothetical protein
MPCPDSTEFLPFPRKAETIHRSLQRELERLRRIGEALIARLVWLLSHVISWRTMGLRSRLRMIF